MKWLVDRMIAYAKKRPYFHLLHADGSPYMGRYNFLPLWLQYFDLDDQAMRPYSWVPFWPRLHNIATADLDRECHDHPATFISVVLRAGYTERRPFDPLNLDFFDGEERCYRTHRKAGSIAVRRFFHRHSIVEVQPDTWTLVIWLPKRQFWGFFTPTGKVFWKKYVSVHSAKATHDHGCALFTDAVKPCDCGFES